MPVKPQFLAERDNKTFVLYAGLLDLAHEEGLKSITTTLLQVPNEDNGFTAICQAVVDTSKGQFSGIGDANPDNVTRLMRPHIIRMAETRAKARALRDAVNVGVAALEELGEDVAAESHDTAEVGQRERTATPAARPTIVQPAAAQRSNDANAPLGVCPVHGTPWRESKSGKGSPWHGLPGNAGFCNKWDMEKAAR